MTPEDTVICTLEPRQAALRREALQVQSFSTS